MSLTLMEQSSTSYAAVVPEQAPPPPQTPIENRRIVVIDVVNEPSISDQDYASRPPPIDDEELPAYEEEAHATAPVYEERHRLAPVISYCFYQISRKLQIITPATITTLDRPRYRVSNRSSPNVFSKKADYTLTKLPRGAQAATSSCSGKDVATMNFDRNGELPWMPRATVVHNGASKKEYPLQARNFSDWKVNIDGGWFTWRLADKPTSLVLVEQSSESIVARFAYSKVGTDATRGAEVGQLDIFGGSKSEDQAMIELVLATCVVAIQHWKSMGRHYKNDVTPRTCSVIGLGNSYFANDGSRFSRRASNLF
jgi:hypothetical protein